MKDRTRKKAQLDVEILALRHKISQYEKQMNEFKRQANQWRCLAENTPDIIINVDRCGRINFINRDAWGFSRDRVKGENLCDYLPERYQDSLSRIIAQVFSTADAARVDLEVVDADGQPKWYDIRVLPLPSPAGLDSVSLICTDITERKRAEEILRESEAVLRSIVRAVPTGIGVVSGKVFRRINDRVCEMMGYSMEELLGENTRMFYDNDEEYKRVAQEKRKQIREKGVGTLETRWRSKNGQMVDVLLSLAPLDPSDLSKGVTFSALDITERKQDEEEKEKLRTRLYQADKMSTVGQLAAGIAHEINNPIGFVLPNLQLLKDQFGLLVRLEKLNNQGASRREIEGFRHKHNIGLVMQEIPQVVSDCLDGARRVRDITQELRQFSRVDEGVEKVPLSELLDSALTIASNVIKYRARIYRAYAQIPEIFVQRGKMIQVFLNMIINAAQAIDEGHELSNWIRVSTGRESEQVYVEIADSGTPIPEENFSKIFDPFYTTKPLGQGTGLGLAISYSIVQQHGGRIEVESRLEKGTLFRIWLPVETACPSDPQQEAKPRNEKSSRLSSRGRVMVIDDEEGVLRYMRRSLSKFHDVVLAAGGQEALAVLNNDQKFDVVLCDLMMPELSGMDLFSSIRDDFPDLAERFIFMTGGAFTPKAVDFAKHIVNQKIEKPIDNNVLLDLVDESVRGSNLLCPSHC
jgi:PAS domain S-box-containing protein